MTSSGESRSGSVTLRVGKPAKGMTLEPENKEKEDGKGELAEFYIYYDVPSCVVCVRVCVCVSISVCVCTCSCVLHAQGWKNTFPLRKRPFSSFLVESVLLKSFVFCFLAIPSFISWMFVEFTREGSLEPA